MALVRFCLCFCGWALALAACAQGQINILADSTELLIGDPVRCTVVVNVPKGAQSVTAPVIGEVLAQSSEVLELLEQSDPIELEGDVNDTYQYPLLLTAWEPGLHDLPALTFSFVYKDSLYSLQSRATTFTASAPTVTGDSTYMADIKPLLAEEPNFWDLLYKILSHPVFIVLLFVLLTAAGLYALVQYRNRIQAAARPPSPEEWALARLEALRNSDYLQRGDVIAFHTEVSYILRAYLKRRFRIDALEHPNSVVLPQVKGHPLLTDAALYEELDTVLRQADLIKFAKASPLPIANEKALTLIANLIRAVQHRLVEWAEAQATTSSTKSLQS